MQTNFPWNERVSLFYASKQTCQSLSFNIVGGTLTLADTKQNMLGLLLNSLDSIWSMLLRTFLSKNEQPWNVGTTTDYWKITPLSILSIFFFSFFEELQWKGQYLVIRDGQRHFFLLLWGNKVPISELMTVCWTERIPLFGSKKSKNLLSLLLSNFKS